MWKQFLKKWLRKCNTCWEIKKLLSENFTEKRSSPWKFWYKCTSCQIKKQKWFRSNNLQHWMSDSRIYGVWETMKKRCTNKKYKNYWWRWIRCLWETFKDFYNDMWSTYKEWLTIDRIDVNWNYCKENCRRATPKEQANNRRNNHILKFLWKKQTISQWSDELWINYSTIKSRINYWFSIEKILSISNLKTNIIFKKED